MTHRSQRFSNPFVCDAETTHGGVEVGSVSLRLTHQIFFSRCTPEPGSSVPEACNHWWNAGLGISHRRPNLIVGICPRSHAEYAWLIPMPNCSAISLTVSTCRSIYTSNHLKYQNESVTLAFHGWLIIIRGQNGKFYDFS